MRRISAISVGSLLLLAACSSDDPGAGAAGDLTGTSAATTVTLATTLATTLGPTSGSRTSSSAPTSGSVAAVPACAVGRWRSDGVRSSGRIGDAEGSVSGGAGTVLTIRSTGGAGVRFDRSSPLAFTAGVGPARVTGQITYTGSVNTTISTAGTDTGTWAPDSMVRPQGLRATVRLTSPVRVTLLDNVSLSDLGSGRTGPAGEALDTQPILRPGNYRCGPDRLQLRTDQSGPDLTWTFSRS